MQIDSVQREQLIAYVVAGDLMKFYKSGVWMALRGEVLSRDNYECQHCKKAGRYRRAELVHHVKEVKLFPALALDIGNLMSLCNSCHNIVHGRTPKQFNKDVRRFNQPERW